MRFFILTFVLFITQLGMASTFVGNGGNAGDIELQMTLGQLRETFHFTNRDKAEEGHKLCVCTESFEGRPLCDFLKQLNQEQVRFCAQHIEQKASDLATLIANKDLVSFSWTHQPIEVQEGGQLRAADAVTDPRTMLMTLNQKRFLEMDEDERVFLVGHELFHLTSFEGKTLSDEGDIGPFKGADGGRKLINAMAASMVMEAHKYYVFKSYRAAEARSKGYKENWVNVGFGSITLPNDKSTSLDMGTVSGGQMGYRHQWTNEWGGLLQLESLKGEKRILATTKANETRNIFSVGGAYRWFPFSNPLTFWGQSHFVFTGAVDLLSAQYSIQDPAVSTTATASTVGHTLGINYFIPFSSGMWAYGGVAYSSHKYTFTIDNDTLLDYKNNGTAFSIGASYGF